MDEKREENKFKEIWSNRRYKAMIQLALYCLFFILIGVFINFDHEDTSDNSVNDRPISFSSYDNYAFYYNITYLGNLDEPLQYINIEGYRDREKQFFELRDTLEKYYMEKGKLYIVKDDLEEVTTPFFLPFDRLSPSFLTTYMEKGRFDSKTEYADGTVKKVYFIPVFEFAKLYQDDFTQKEGFVSMTTYEKNKIVNKVELDLTIYNQMKLELNYKEIGKVSPFYKEDIIPAS